MGIAGFVKPGVPAIVLGGYWKYVGEDSQKLLISDDKDKKVVLAPNARSWAIRNAIPPLVNVMALYFGTKECYLIMIACSIWRETFDIIEAFLDGDTSKVFVPAKVAPGKIPPLPYFPPWLGLLVGNLCCLYVVANVKED